MIFLGSNISEEQKSKGKEIFSLTLFLEGIHISRTAHLNYLEVDMDTCFNFVANMTNHRIKSPQILPSPLLLESAEHLNIWEKIKIFEFTGYRNI